MKSMKKNTTVIEDDKGKIIAEIDNNGHIALARSPDMTKEVKDYLVDLVTDLTNEDSKTVRSFLNYENEENEFCS